MNRVLVVAVLFAGACGDSGVTPPSAVLADSADQVMDSMWTNIVRDGIKVSRVEADTAFIYQARQFADLKGLRITFFDSIGRVSSSITATSGTYQMRDAILDARGSVVATNPDGKVLKTEHFVYDRQSNQISSDTAFTFTSPQGNGSGASFTSDIGFKNVVTLRPKGRQKGQGFVLPGERQ